jgi:predicted short-subunit dehydrogenase-like oxidoreductase (DUF2520 family)
MRIVFIGSGNIAHFFATRLHKKGHEIVQVYSRTRNNGDQLAALTGAAVTDNLSELNYTADVYILAIKDDALGDIASRLSFKDKVVIHCAGAVPLDILADTATERAVIWSLFSIRKQNLPVNGNIPLVVEASGERALNTALQLAHDISERVLQTDFRQRQMLHLNAVLANNFTNHLLHIAELICKENDLPFDVLYPIIRQTFEQTEHILPSQSQTGPALRHDEDTINKHLQLLAPHQDWQKIYADISRSIQQLSSEKQNHI